MVHARKRVSYIIPSPTESVPRLELPRIRVSRLGATGPLLKPLKNAGGGDLTRDGSSPKVHEPRHRLGIASLALDSSTQLVGHNAPEGILYSGGRDGLIMSYDLGLPLRRKKAKAKAAVKDGGGDRGYGRATKWEVLTGWGDDAIDEETDEDGPMMMHGGSGHGGMTSDGDVLGDVTGVFNSNRKRRGTIVSGEWMYERQWETEVAAFEAGTPTRFRQRVQAHADWVNDILLCNYNQTVISASSDGTVKAWNPHETPLSDASTIGTHSDYVRCLVHCYEQNWIASGSFDRTIKLWDLNSSPGKKKPIVTLNLQDASAPKSSIYALAVDPNGQMIASGSPERVVRLWDPRSGKRTGKLVGHTDNIRAILISADSKYLLTGSADASIKLWSLVTQRCLHTFAHHTESVWSLYSDHPSLQVFYSGDRSGLVCRVDVEDCTDLSEAECVLLCNESQDTSRPMSEGINKIVVMDDNLLWTASGTSTLKRWHIPQRKTQRSTTYVLDMDGDRVHQQYHHHHPPPLQSPPKKRRPLPAVPIGVPLAGDVSTEGNMWLTAEHNLSGTLSLKPSIHSLSSEPLLRDREADVKWNGLPYDSLIKLISANDPYPPLGGRSKDPEVATLYSAASIMSLPRHTGNNNIARAGGGGGGPLLVHPSSSIVSPLPGPLQSSRTDDTWMARTKYEERELAADAVPICAEPDFVIPGDAGLVRCIVLNDRMHALTVDTLGEVGVWDIVRCICLGRYMPEDIAAACHHQSGSSSGSSSLSVGGNENERSPREALEVVRERIEGEAVVSPWCLADTKAGVLTVHLIDKCFEAEVYADEVGYENYRHFTDESRINLGRWVLRNLFLGFMREEIQRQKIQRNGGELPTLSRASSKDILDNTTGKSVHPEHCSSTLTCATNMIPAVVPNVPAVVRTSPLIAPLIPLHTHLASSLPSATHAHTQSSSGHHHHHHSQTRSGTLDGSDGVSSSSEKPTTTSITQGSDDPSTASGTSSRTDSQASTSVTPTGLMGRLRNFGRTKRPNSDTPINSPSPIAETPTSFQLGPPVVEIPKSPIQKLLQGPLNPPSSSDAPTIALPPNTTILISEESGGSSQSYNTTLYRGLVCQSAGREADHAGSNNVDALEEVIPMWLAEYLLLDRVPLVMAQAGGGVVKVSFILVPWNKEQDSVDPLPELLNTQQSKLTANRTLRIRKILLHVQEKLDRIPSVAPSVRSSVDGNSSHRNNNGTHPQQQPGSTRARAEDLYEILCNDTVLPLRMTLAAVRQYVWKSSAELVLYYRRRRKPGPRPSS